MNMKKIFLFIVCLSLLSASNASESSIQANVKGSGNVVNKLRKVENFNKLDIDGTFNIYLSQGDTESLRIETDDNLHQYILTKVVNGKLIIKVAKNVNFRNVTKNNIYIKVKDIELINAGGMCDISGTTKINSDKLFINASGMTNIKLNIFCDQLNIKSSGMSDCIFKGKADVIIIDSSGTNDIIAKDFIAEKAFIQKSGMSDISVYANKEISISSSGIGDITYYGNPVIKKLEKSGIGDIIKK